MEGKSGKVAWRKGEVEEGGGGRGERRAGQPVQRVGDDDEREKESDSLRVLAK